MATLLQLRNEGPWWNAEIMSPTMQKLAERLRLFYGVGPANIGAKGDTAPGHMQGAHRSRAWITNSMYCTNRIYTVTETQGNRTGGDDNWLAGMDITVPAAQLIPMCQRLDVAVRAGQLEKITEWYGNDDGDSRVDGYNNIRNQIATSDASHLWHLHLTFDRGRAGEDHSDLYAILTGTSESTTVEDDMWIIWGPSGTGYLATGDLVDSRPVVVPFGPYERAQAYIAAGVRAVTSTVEPKAPYFFVTEPNAAWPPPKPPVEVELSDEDLQELAEQVAAALPPPLTYDQTVDAVEKGANKAEDS